MWAVALQSGSKGNCVYVEAGDVRLLFDAGISGRQARLRLNQFNRDISDVHAILISHDHRDHVVCAGILHRKFNLPIWITPMTLSHAQEHHDLGSLQLVEHFQAGGVIRFRDIRIETYPTAHDAADGCCFVVDDGRRRLGLLTDLGHAFPGLAQLLTGLDAVFLESNFDHDMLQQGRYPLWLKRRVSGPSGHLSNVEAAELVRDYGERLQWVALAHLSEENNSPDLARHTHRTIVGRDLPVHLTHRHMASEALYVE